MQFVVDQEGFDDVVVWFGEMFQIICQFNFGGLGGFVWVMYEMLQCLESDFVQLFDDDVWFELELLWCLIVFGQFVMNLVFVGGYMFDLFDCFKLYGWVEVVDEGLFMWCNFYQEKMLYDFGVLNLCQLMFLYMCMDVDYNGWWMCFILFEVICKVGFVFFVFIKWDDVEFCFCVGEVGFLMVLMFGVVFWYVFWVNKDDLIDWQVYFYVCNCIVVGFIYFNVLCGGCLIVYSCCVDFKYLMMMQYYFVVLCVQVLWDIFFGLDYMCCNLVMVMLVVCVMVVEFLEIVVYCDFFMVLYFWCGCQVYKQWLKNDFDNLMGLWLCWFILLMLILYLIYCLDFVNVVQFEVEFGKDDVYWWCVFVFDSVLVSVVDGLGKNIYMCDCWKYCWMLCEIVWLYVEFCCCWLELQWQYCVVFFELVFFQFWQQIFEEKV